MKLYNTFIVLLISCFSLTVTGFFNDNSNKGCPEPEIENGDHRPRKFFLRSFAIFEKITFFCDNGFELEGEAQERCWLGGKWRQLPRCVAKGARSLPCVLPPVGDHVDVEPRKAAYVTDETVTFACAGLRKTEGYAMSRCGEDGEFYPTPPKCIQPKCVPPTTPEDGVLRPNKTSYSVGDVVNFKCQKGFQLVGSTNTTCGEDGYFTYSDAKCEASSTKCYRPENPQNGRVIEQDMAFKLGDTITFECDTGYVVLGRDQTTCGSDGNFHPDRPTCYRFPTKCDRPENPRNGRVMEEKMTFNLGDEIKFKCDIGYVMLGQDKTTCGSDGWFHPPQPSCHETFHGYYY